MSLITEAFGKKVLKMPKGDVITLIRNNKAIPPQNRAQFLNDWSAATGIKLTKIDYNYLEWDK